MYFHVEFIMFFKLIKVHLLVSELYIYQNVRCNDNKMAEDTSLYPKIIISIIIIIIIIIVTIIVTLTVPA